MKKKFFIGFLNQHLIDSHNKYKLKNKLSKLYKKINLYKNLLPKIKKTENNPYINKIWVMWLQNIDNAPQIIRLCIDSIKKYANGREVIILTKENLKNYIQLPDYIEEKHEKGIITHAAYSDIVRLYLLYKYAGTWMDSTLYCTDNLEWLLEQDFIIYKEYSTKLPYFIASWFMHSKVNKNYLIKTMLLLHYAYWKENNSLCDYFLIYYLHKIAIEEDKKCKKIWKKTPLLLTYNAKLYLRELCGVNGGFNPVMLEHARKLNPFHKLTYKSDYFILKIDQDKLCQQIIDDIETHK